MRWWIGVVVVMVVLIIVRGANAADLTLPPALSGVGRGGFELETVRVSINPNGEQGNGISSGAALSADGRRVAFSSSSYNLTDEDQSPVEDIFVHDLETGALTILSTVAVGESQDGDSRAPRISADGTLVVWESMATNLVAGDTNDAADIFLRPYDGGPILRVSVNSAGEEGNGISWFPDISADGSVVVFTSSADNLVPGDTNGNPDIFVVALPTPTASPAGSGTTRGKSASPVWRGGLEGEVTRVSVASDGTQANGMSTGARLSADGRFVVFQSNASNLVPGDTNDVYDTFVHDRTTGVTERVSVATDGTQGDRDSIEPVISADGRYVAFESAATTFVPADAALHDIFRHDRSTGMTTLVSMNTYTAATHDSRSPAITADGRYVLFSSLAANLVPGDTNGHEDIFRKDMSTGAVVRLSVSSSNQESNHSSTHPATSADGRVAAFSSRASNLVPGDTNGLADVFAVTVLNDPAPTSTLFLPAVLSGKAKDFAYTTHVLTAGANGNSAAPTLSADGNQVAFTTEADNLVAGDTNGVTDVLVWERATGQLRRVSVASDGAQANGVSYEARMAGGGRYVLFLSDATNLAPADTNQLPDLFRHDLATGVTELVSVGMAGGTINGTISRAEFSADGRWVVFSSDATNLTPIPLPGECLGAPCETIYLRDMANGTTTTLLTDEHGNALAPIREPSISADGAVIAFEWVKLAGYSSGPEGSTIPEYAPFIQRYHRATGDQFTIAESYFMPCAGSCWSNQVKNPTVAPNGAEVSYWHRYTSSAFPCSSVSLTWAWNGGRMFGSDSGCNGPERGGIPYPTERQGRFAVNGDYVVFSAPDDTVNGIADDENHFLDIYRMERTTQEVRRISDLPGGGQSNGDAADPAINHDGTVITFATNADSLTGEIGITMIVLWEQR